ncbi:High-affinity branched-chain amino acid transport system permease protein LivH [Methylobacterium crusticola]|uniref:High-affinity branched-chain amino acid transport system permease protein LivH n=1 Tax=Methylobacterium crusticola TaxID=1697972 RepID=A0ABQ4R691_9HYPH|nr:branched-chain amino acid ABC transporter permease [Methylobacterium crusticola]GJD53232.1 High-affinity branched-chain amino acid transport system permease protein LivH [Methylobacterium crusticola]
MNLEALAACVASASCAVTQVSTGLIVGTLLFLVAAGLSLIFGVLGVINFAHGAFYMLGAYFAFSAYTLTGSFLAALAAGALGVAAVGVAFERLIMSRVYGRDLLMQLLVCYAVILILDDGVKILYGGEYRLMGMPEAFAAPPVEVAGGFIPAYYLFMVGMALAAGLALWLGINRTRTGKIVRALAINPQMVGALGINTTLLYAGVFGLGSLLAGVAGALAAPIRTLTPGMGLSILIESFIVTVIGGMGSIAGAFLAALLIGFTRAFGAIGFPLFVDGTMFAIMALVLMLKPSGLLGREAA